MRIEHLVGTEALRQHYHARMMTDTVQRCVKMLGRWAQAAERYWTDMPDGMGVYGTGYDWWGVQTVQKHVAAMAVLGAATGDQRATRRALAGLRFNLATHVSGEGEVKCSDGSRWGHTWISPLGIERMMFGVQALGPHLTDEDRAALRRVLASEADWQMNQHRRGQFTGVHADRWNHSGRNNPESNLWCGALLWRTAMMYPDEGRAPAWRDAAERFLFNSVSVEADAGHPLYVGANFFPSFAMDHHGYLNVGYMVICTSNAALLHFDLKALQLPRPEHLDHHHADLWQVIRLMTFDDGRLARIGGDSRLRYTYCQEYLLPSLLYAADQLGDADALTMVGRQLDLIETEIAHAGDGTFYGKRLAELAEASPYYYTRLESDRACAVASVIAYAPLLSAPTPDTRAPTPVALWHEPEHGAVVHRSATRFASFAWRGHGYAQGLCLPPGRSDLAEWSHNLAGVVRFMGQPETFTGGQTPHRRLLRHHTTTFEGGFITVGSLMEGVKLSVPEGLTISDMATHDLCFAALPDGHTVVGLQRCVVNDKRAYPMLVQGMRLNVPNDLYNGFSRRVATAGGVLQWTSPAERSEAAALRSAWACVDDVMGVVGLYGADTLTVDRSVSRRGGHIRSLYVDELCLGYAAGARAAEPGAVLLDVGWRVMAGVDAATTEALVGGDEVVERGRDDASVRTVIVVGCDGRRYRVTADFDACRGEVELLG